MDRHKNVVFESLLKKCHNIHKKLLDKKHIIVDLKIVKLYDDNDE